MAKKGYRGKHPHNDMKVPKEVSSGKYSTKLTTEYNKLPTKQKYSYIRSNYFFPQATMVISGTANFVENSAFTMSAHDGTLLSMSGSTATLANSTHAFKADGNSKQASEGIRDIVNNNMANLITASVTTVAGGAASNNDAVVNLTMVEPGIDGNTTLTLNGGAKSTPEEVTFNGTAANASSSLFTGG